MAKRLLKLTAGQLIKDLDKWKTTYLHFVTDDKRTRLLKPIRLDKKNLVTKDTKHHTIMLNLSSVSEIWTETDLV